MRITWDRRKAAANVKKHGVEFDEALTVLASTMTVRFEYNHHDEHRFIATGYSRRARILVVVYCYRFDDEIRIISARAATRKERRQYEEGI